MAGAMRKMAVYLGLVEDDRYDEGDAFEGVADSDGVERADQRADLEASHSGRAAARSRRGAGAAGAIVSALAPHETVAAHDTTQLPRAEAPDAYRITTIHPRTYNEAKQIGETFRDNIPVIMNLTEMDDADAKRLVDFAAGLVFGLRGTIERVTSKVFLLSPVNVSVTAEDKVRLAERSFFNQS